MLVRALLQTSLVLWLAQQTLQGGVKPQSVSWGRVLPARVAGHLGALRSRYGNKAMKTGIGRYPAVQLGVGGHRSLSLGGRAGLKQGAYGGQAPYGASLGTGMPLGTGLTNGLGLGLGQAGKHAYGAGLGTLPGYGALAGNGYTGARPGPGLGYPTGHKAEERLLGYLGGAGNHLGAGLGAGGYGPGLGQGAYLGGAAGNLGAAAGLGQDGYPHGVAGRMNGYGEGATGYLGAAAGNGYGGDAGAKALAAAGYGNGYSDGYGAGLGYPAELTDGAENKAGKSKALNARGFNGQVQGAFGTLGAGLESTGGKYGAGTAQVPYGNAPVIPAGLEGDGGYPYAAQQLGLGAEGAKTSSKHGEQPGKYGGMNGALGNGYKG